MSRKIKKNPRWWCSFSVEFGEFFNSCQVAQDETISMFCDMCIISSLKPSNTHIYTRSHGTARLSSSTTTTSSSLFNESIFFFFSSFIRRGFAICFSSELNYFVNFICCTFIVSLFPRQCGEKFKKKIINKIRHSSTNASYNMKTRSLN